VIGVFACLFGEARGGLPRRACQYRVCRFWCLYNASFDATLAVIEPHTEFLELTKHGTAMMDGDLVPEAYRLGHITAVGEAESVRRVWNSH